MNYPDSLPKELRSHYMYLPQDGGHVITAIPACLLPQAVESGKYDCYTVPVPVKYVLEKGFRVLHDYIIIDAPYDNDLGVQIDERYEEYDETSAKGDNGQQYIALKVGKCYPYFQKFSEAVFLKSNVGSLDLVFVYVHPKEIETLNIREGKIQIKTISVNDVSFLLIKFGELPWMDAAYNPYTSSAPLQQLPAGTGYTLNIMFADGWTGELKVNRIYGMDEKLSSDFKKNCDRLTLSGIDNATFHKRTDEVFQAYSTDQLVELADKVGSLITYS